MSDLWADIENADFTLVKRGYEPAEVDAFLDRLGEAVKDLEGEVAAAHGKINAQKRQIGELSGRDDSVEQTILAAVDRKQAILDDAERRAQKIIGEAERRAQKLAEGPDADVAQVHAEAEKVLLHAQQSLEKAEEEAERLRAEAAEEADKLLVEARRDSLAVLEESKAEATRILEAARRQHKELTTLLRALKASVADMLTGAEERHETIRVVLSDEEATAETPGMVVGG
jgi:DivIVA domain-containing protein